MVAIISGPMARTTQIERRTTPRLVVSHPISFEWLTKDGELHRARGTTRDIALGGVYCQVERPLANGQIVEFDVVLPGELAEGQPVRLHCRGKVLRSERTEQGFGVAVTIETSEAVEPLARTADAARQRLYTRIIPPSVVIAEYPGMRSVVRDLSLVGAFIEDERPLPVARVFDLHLSGEKLYEEIALRAIVRRVEPHVGMAVEFVAMTPEAKERLKKILGLGREWQSAQAAFPSAAWQPAEATGEPVNLDGVKQFVQQRARQLLPQLEVQGCFYRVVDRRFSLHLRDPVSQAELLLPLSEQWVQACQVEGDCSRLDRALESAARILSLHDRPSD